MELHANLLSKLTKFVFNIFSFTLQFSASPPTAAGDYPRDFCASHQLLVTQVCAGPIAGVGSTPSSLTTIAKTKIVKAVATGTSAVTNCSL